MVHYIIIIIITTLTQKSIDSEIQFGAQRGVSEICSLSDIYPPRPPSLVWLLV